MRSAIIGLAFAVASWSGAASAQDKPAFVFTAIPDQDETRLVERFTRVAEHLQGKLGLPVKYLPVIVTLVPPSVSPLAGETCVTPGASSRCARLKPTYGALAFEPLAHRSIWSQTDVRNGVEE